MSEIVLQVIALIFKGVEAFVFDFPMGTTGTDQEGDVIPGNDPIGDPAIGIMNGFVAVVVHRDDPIAEKIGDERVAGAVQGNAMKPFVHMGAPFFVACAASGKLIGTSGDGRHHGFV